jgi:ABC-2 type transport system permease protein
MTSLLAPDTAATATGRTGSLAGLAVVARLTLRRSRWFWLLWVLVLWVTVPSTVARYSDLVPDTEVGRLTVQALAANPTMRAMLGPPFDLLNAGGFTMFRVGGFVAAAAGVMAALGVIRATRAEEEDGRVELLRSGAVGRHAPLAASLVVAFGACLVLALLIAGSVARSAPPASSALAMGLGIGLTGAVFAGVGAVAAQLTESARSARGIAMAVLGAAYLLRAVADGAAESSPLRVLQWISPVEWAALARPYAAERWWVLLLPLLLTGLLVALAFQLEEMRDHGAGLRAARPGPANAPSTLSSAFGLSWRLHRGSIVGWSVAVVVGSVAIGSLSGSVDQIVTENPAVADMFRRMSGGAQELRDGFFVAMLGIMVGILAIFAMQLFGRLPREEEQGHAEVLLATATSRTRFATSHLVPALLVPTLLLAATGVCLAVPQAVADGSLAVVWQIAGSALALAPGLWLVVGLAMAVHGWAPRLGVIPWIVVGWSLFMLWLGGVINLPKTLLDATPFAPLPQLPVETFTWGPFLAVTAIAVLLLVAGLAGFGRRDIATK